MKKVFVVAAHPDDGTLMRRDPFKHIDQGDKVYILFVTEGVSADTKKMRSINQKKKFLERKYGKKSCKNW